MSIKKEELSSNFIVTDECKVKPIDFEAAYFRSEFDNNNYAFHCKELEKTNEKQSDMIKEMEATIKSLKIAVLQRDDSISDLRHTLTLIGASANKTLSESK